MKKYAILTLVLVALLSACGKPGDDLADDGSSAGGKPTGVNPPSNPNPSNPNNPNSSAAITIRVVMSGNVGTDNVTASPASGKAGDEITLNYTLANTYLHNRLVFSGTRTAIEQVNGAGTGAKKYIVNAEDSSNSVITINAVFTHSNLELDTIEFDNDGPVIKPYGISPFIRAIKNTGSGTGAISYTSSDPSVATVNSSTGEVTIHNMGITDITATKASDGIYAEAKAMYTLRVVSQVVEVPRFTIVDFEADAIGKTYDSTKAGSAPTVKVAADPLNSGQKSLQITSTTYNQAAIVPVNLPYELHNYVSFSFRFNLLSSSNLNNQSIMVYAAKNTADFKQYGFGNPADSSYAQFAANLIGSTPAENIGDNHRNTWNDYEIEITNPGEKIKDLKGDIYLAIGINCQNGADYLIDDLIFIMRDDFNPPPIVILPPPNPSSTGAVSSKTYRNMFKEWGKTDAEVTVKVNTTWNKLFNGTETEKIYYTVGSDMAYILDSGNNDVRSEGMSYGMMMCVQLDKKAEFDRLWKWAKTNMYNTAPEGKNARGYFAWQCGTDGSKKDKGPAPDGEEYFITALLFAHARWGSSASGIYNYAKEARQVIYDLTRRDTAKGDPYGEPSMFNTSNHMVRFATLGNSATFTDPSYHLPAFYEVWALELESDWNNNNLYGIWTDKADLKKDVDFFKQAASTSRTFFKNATNSTTGLGPDYAEFDGSPKNEGDHKHFEYDAWRIAMNIGMDYAWWAKDPWQVTFANRIQAFFVSKGVTSYGNRWTLDGTQRGADHSPGLVACNAVASFAATHENAWKFIEDFWNISMTTGQYRYYDGCLYMLGLLHVSGNFKAYLSTNTTPTPPVPSSSISPTTATFDKKTGSQADITVTMTLNGNTLSSISNGGTTLTSGNQYTVSGSTVTIKKEYLAAQANGSTTLVFTFSAGSTQNLVITVKDTTSGGGGTGTGTGTSYNFATDSIPAGYPTYSTTGLTASKNGSVLQVTKTTGHSTVYFTLPFNIGTKSLTEYSGIKLNIRGSSGDYGNKGFLARVGKSGSSTTVPLTSIGNAGLSGSFKDITVLIPSTVSSYTGEIEIGFAFDNTPAFGCEIASIELIAK